MLIEDLTSSGEGVGTIDGKKVFIDGALPGEEVEVAITLSKKRYAKAKLLKITTASKDRVKPICPLFGICGGCQIMHLDYPAQLKWKTSRVKNALLRIGGLEVVVADCVPSPDKLYYRNKIHLHEGGFHKRHTHDIVPIEKCYIHNLIGEKELPEVKNAKEAIIKTSLSTKETLVIKDGKPDKEFIFEKLGDLTFKIRPFDFFQVNSKQALQLYEKAIEGAKLDNTMCVLDAYCGVGTLSLFAAAKAKEVHGIEIVKTAVESARENATLNGITNATFQCGKVENLFPKMNTFDVIFLNPPRGGVEEQVLEAILDSSPKQLIYISCDPATLARDLKILSKGFSISSVLPFDMFPQTVHVETLTILQQLA